MRNTPRVFRKQYDPKTGQRVQDSTQSHIGQKSKRFGITLFIVDVKCPHCNHNKLFLKPAKRRQCTRCKREVQ